MLVPPIPAMMPSMIFSSKVLSSSSSSARTAPLVMTRPMPSAMAESRNAWVNALDDFCTVRPLALRIAFPVQMFPQAANSKRNSAPASNVQPTRSVSAGIRALLRRGPQEGIIQEGRYPGNNGHVGQVKYVPIVGISPDLEVKQGEIDHRAIGEAVDAVADGTANDQAERQRRDQGPRPRHPDRQHNHCHGLDDHQADLGDLAVVLEPAEADPDVPGQHQIEERCDPHGAAVTDAEHEQQPEF